ncbi:uncharacterized protein LOC121668385 [Corvus kubaryi]|uniref:uncharacterized protein LOC121668385 n=1 Tax=Corvus kubaryi TaxID=68294 RepID=UPI001C057A05|nr:uncharacterized protein LOC121668385 [Corvus kubaryi]
MRRGGLTSYRYTIQGAQAAGGGTGGQRCRPRGPRGSPLWIPSVAPRTRVRVPAAVAAPRPGRGRAVRRGRARRGPRRACPAPEPGKEFCAPRTCSPSYVPPGPVAVRGPGDAECPLRRRRGEGARHCSPGQRRGPHSSAGVCLYVCVSQPSLCTSCAAPKLRTGPQTLPSVLGSPTSKMDVGISSKRWAAEPFTGLRPARGFGVVEVTQRDTAVNLPSPGFSWSGWHFPSIQVSGGKKFILIAARPGSHSHTIPGKCGLLGVSCEGESCSKAVCLVVLRVPPDKSVIPKQKISLQCIWLVLPYGQQAVSVNTKT